MPYIMHNDILIDREQLGIKLKEYRKKMLLTQSDLSDLTGHDCRTIRRYESGDFSSEIPLKDLCKSAGLDFDELIAGCSFRISKISGVPIIIPLK